MDQATPQLDPSELYDKRKSKDASRLKAYNKILEQIYNRIRVSSRLPNSQCYLLYTVPPFILGLPKIDMEDCMIYLIYQLRHAGYDVRYTPPNMVSISWMHHEKSYLVQQSPIMQAMLESAEKTQAEMERKEKEASRLIQGRKSQRKVRMYTPGELQGPTGASKPSFRPQAHTAFRPQAGPALPSASDYVPPSIFLQNVAEPSTQASQAKSHLDYFRS
jgi:hypothetical protein